MRIVFLGTSSAVPTPSRNVSSLAIAKDDGGIWLVDCGEGTQHRLQTAPVRSGRIERILITHLHGDHCFGLFGLLSSLSMQGRTDSLELIGPRGIERMVRDVLGHADTRLGYGLQVTELDRACDLGVRDGLGIAAHPIAHRVACFGYVLEEPVRRGVFDPERARAAGVPSGPLFGRLASGEDVAVGDRIVRSADVVGPSRAGRKLVVLGDTRDPSGIADAARGCDALVHESTFPAGDEAHARSVGHSTSAMAGRFARSIAARRLLLNHFSARFADSELDRLGREAARECPDTEVLVARDGASFEIEARP
jgi:ribonuclease Z